MACTLTSKKQMSHDNTFQKKTHLFKEEVLPSVDKDNATGQLEKHFSPTGICVETFTISRIIILAIIA